MGGTRTAESDAERQERRREDRERLEQAVQELLTSEGMEALTQGPRGAARLLERPNAADR